MSEREARYTAVLPSARCDPRLLAELRRRADAAGLNYAEYMRLALTIALGLEEIRPVGD